MDILKTVDIIEVLEGFLEKRRPPVEIRKQVDLEYRIEGDSILILEIRPVWNDRDRIIERGIVKGTYIKSKDHWKIFWMRADMKWHNYKPYPAAKSLAEFVDVVEEDSHSCFWG
jgi:hypothetical protein